MIRTNSLVDDLFTMTECAYISDMRTMAGSQRRILADAIRTIPSTAYSLFAWNDALTYLTEHFEQSNAKEARELLIHSLDS